MSRLYPLLTAITLILPTFVHAVNPPKAAGDVLGRDNGAYLDNPLISHFAGHAGIAASPTIVSHVGGGLPSGQVLGLLTYKSFEDIAGMWGARYKATKFNYDSSRYSSAEAHIIGLTNQQSPHVDYTRSMLSSTPASQVCTKRGLLGKCLATGWKRGAFRCDTYVGWVYKETKNGILITVSPYVMWHSNPLIPFVR